MEATVATEEEKAAVMAAVASAAAAGAVPPGTTQVLSAVDTHHWDKMIWAKICKDQKSPQKFCSLGELKLLLVFFGSQLLLRAVHDI